jgi:hypothetical protein
MDLVEGIRKLGFRRWYERQLIESHLYFVSGFLSMILVAAALEQFSSSSGGTQAIMAALVAIAGMLSIWSFSRYKFMLSRAVYTAERSTCGNCRTHGVLEVLQHAMNRTPDAETAPWIQVRCRRCGHRWTIE